MANNVNTRELILGILLEVNKDGEQSHVAIRRVLEKYQYLGKQERAFITRICEGTIENKIKIDYILNQFSSVKVGKMKPVIREILRSSIYQILWMDSVPSSAICNEAVKLAKKKGFFNLAGFVNAVLRKAAKEAENIPFPKKENRVEYLSVMYSMPKWLVEKWMKDYGEESTEKMLKAFLTKKPVTVRIRQFRTEEEVILENLKKQGIRVEKAPYVPHAYRISGYDYLSAIGDFRLGNLLVQDVSSMLAGEIAGFEKDNYVIDLCAAPGGKSLYAADKLMGTGLVDSRDVSDYKAALIEENVQRAGIENIKVSVKDATVLDHECVEKADIVLADVPCSGLGVIGKKSDIKYNMTAAKQQELVKLQRQILENASCYVKPGGVLIYSTCTIGEAENQENVRWFTENFPYKLESLEPYLCEELHGTTASEGYLQLLPGVHDCDGFFIARLRRASI